LALVHAGCVFDVQGSAFKNKGVQALLDAVGDYLPCPTDVVNMALDLDQDEKPLVSLHMVAQHAPPST